MSCIFETFALTVCSFGFAVHPRQGVGTQTNFFAFQDGTVSLAVVPEPASVAMFAAVGFVAIGFRRRRQTV